MCFSAGKEMHIFCHLKSDGESTEKLDVSDRYPSVQFSCSVVSDSATPWTAPCQGSKEGNEGLPWWSSG